MNFQCVNNATTEQNLNFKILRKRSHNHFLKDQCKEHLRTQRLRKKLSFITVPTQNNRNMTNSWVIKIIRKKNTVITKLALDVVEEKGCQLLTLFLYNLEGLFVRSVKAIKKVKWRRLKIIRTRILTYDIWRNFRQKNSLVKISTVLVLLI